MNTLLADADRKGNVFCLGSTKSCSQVAPDIILLFSKHQRSVPRGFYGCSQQHMVSLCLSLFPVSLIIDFALMTYAIHCVLSETFTFNQNLWASFSWTLHKSLSLSHTYSLSILLQPRFITAICQWSCLASWHILWQPICICFFFFFTII